VEAAAEKKGSERVNHSRHPAQAQAALLVACDARTGMCSWRTAQRAPCP
jgi:hypothetical protein